MKSSYEGRMKNFFIKENRVLCQVTPKVMSATGEIGLGGGSKNNLLPMGKGSNLPTRKGQSLPLTKGIEGKNGIGKSLRGGGLIPQRSMFLGP